MNLCYGSLFTGAGGFDMGFDAAGFRCAWQVECDKAANSVLRRHWPGVTRCRDVCGFSRVPKRFGSWLDRWERPSIIVGGFPCQDVSLAGRRAGIQGGTRSGLFYEFARILRGLQPDFVVWENVPGLLTSDNGRDFARILDRLGECGYIGGWRILDAQHFGVAQRRKRVFGVFARRHLGTGVPAEVLALGSCVSGDRSPSRQTEKEIAGTLGGGTAGRGWNDDTDRTTFVVPTVTAKWAKGSGGPGDDECQNLVAFSTKDYGADAGELSPPIRAVGAHRSKQNGGGPIAIANCRISHTLTGEGHDASEDGTGRGTPVVAVTLTAVRRLMPIECERLMGWPDNWTAFTDKGKPIKDGPRYRLCGNGVVGTVSEWIARRLYKALQRRGYDGKITRDGGGGSSQGLPDDGATSRD